MEAHILHHQKRESKERNRRKVKIGCHSGISGLSHDEYITIENNHVVWSCGPRIIKSFQLAPSITPNTDIPMTLRSATTMNVDTPVNYLRDNTHTLDTNHNDSIYDKLPFVDDNIFNVPTMQSLSQHNTQNIPSINKKRHKSNDTNLAWLPNINRNANNPLKQNQQNTVTRLRENNENVNTDNCYPGNALFTPSIQTTDTDTTDTELMSLEEEEEHEKVEEQEEKTPPAMIKQDDVLCDDSMEVEITREYSADLSSKGSYSGLTQVMDGINIKTPKIYKRQQERKRNEMDENTCDDATVMDAVWCYFPFPNLTSNEPERCLCLLQNENITVISLSGDIYYVPLPCETRSMFALPEGLIVQAKTQNNVQSNDNYHYPILFSLLNPLEELRPISLHLLSAKSKSLYFDEYYDKCTAKLQSNARSKTCTKPSADGNIDFKLNKTGFESPKIKRKHGMFGHKSHDATHGDFFWNNDETVIFSSLTQPIMVTFNCKSYYHTIWVIRHDKKEINKRVNTKGKNKSKKNSIKQKQKAFESSLNFGGSDDDMSQSSFLHSKMNQTSISSIRGLLAGSATSNKSARKNLTKAWRSNKKNRNKKVADSPMNMHSLFASTPIENTHVTPFVNSASIIAPPTSIIAASDDEDTHEAEDETGLFSELFVECCWKENLGVLYDKVKSIYGAQIANQIDFNERADIFFGCDIYNDPLICIFRPKSHLIASYRLKCKSLDETFSGKCGVGVNNMISQNGSTSLNIELLFVWCGIKDIKPVRSLRSLSHCDDDDSHYYQFYSLNAQHNRNDAENQISFETILNGNKTAQSQSQSLLHQMQEMSSFDYDLLVLNDFTKRLSIYSGNYKLCDVILPQSLNLSTIKSLNHAVNNRVSLMCYDSEQYRIIIPRWDKNIRVIAVLKCFQLFLTPDLMHCIRILLIELHNVHNGALWYELCQIILYFTTTTSSNVQTNEHSTISPTHNNSTSAWQKLQMSDFHKLMSENEACLSKLSSCDHNDSINIESQTGLKCQGFVDIDIQTKLQMILNKFDQLSRDESNDKQKWDTPNEYMDIKYILSQITEQYRFKMLLSIHLLYENCKLSILLKSHLEPLVLLLSKISLSMSMHSYFDSYCRDFAHKIMPQLSKYDISNNKQDAYDDKHVVPVPSIHETILQCMRGNRKPLDEFPVPSANLLFDLSSVLSPQYNKLKPKQKKRKPNDDEDESPFNTGSTIFSPLLSPYSLLRKVCYFYDILTKQTQNANIHQTPHISSRYSLRQRDYHSNISVTPLQINSSFMDHTFITPYTPSSIKRSMRGGIMSPCTPFTRHTSSRFNKKNHPPSKMSLDSSLISPGFTTRTRIHRGNETEAYPFFSPSFLIKEESVYDAMTRAEQLTLAMVEENFTLNDIDCLPLGIALPLREALRSCKYNPTHNWPKAAYLLIGREDLVKKGSINDTEDNDADADETHHASYNDNASPLGSFSQSARTNGASGTFVAARDKYKYEFGPNKHNKGYLGKRYHVKKILQSNIGAPSPKLCAVNDINALHKSSDYIRSASNTLRSLFMTNAGFVASSMVKSTRQRLMNQFGGTQADSLTSNNFVAKLDYDGTLTVLDECLLQFGSDYRLKEVRRILRSDKARRIRDIIGNGRINSNQDHGRNISTVPEYHINLFHQIKRRLAQCIGRGMFTIWSYRPTATKPMDIPHLNVSGIVPARNLKLDIDFTIIQNTVNAYLTTNISGSNDDNEHKAHHLSTFDDIIFQEYEEVDNELFLQWVEFHNGCSAGLRVLSNYDESRENVRTWICYNKPKTPSYAHAGFLFAQGLNGHLTCLMPADFYWYLGHKHEPSTMAIILGLSIARRGTMDTYVHKICCLHIASMVPGGFAELGIETTVQACALLGCGFLFMGTKHKLSTDMLLVEIVRRSSSGSGAYNNANNNSNQSNSANNENIEDRECYSLCAGIALGLIHLGVGGEQHLNLENRLEQLMGATGKRCKMLHYLYDIFNARTCASSNYTGSSQPISKYGITTGIPGGAGANSQSTITGLSVFATSNIINPSIAAHDGGHKSSNDKSAAAAQQFDVDEIVSGKNHLRAAIHYFMPNFSDFPDINDDYNNNDDELNGNSRIRDGQWVNTNMTAPGAILAFGLMYLKTNNESAAKRLVIPTKPYLLDYIQPEWIYLKVLCRCIILWNSITYKESYFNEQIPAFIADNFPYHEEIKAFNTKKNKVYNKTYNCANMDYHAITLAYINIITGTCFAVGLKYAGTHNTSASAIICHYLVQFLKCTRKKHVLKNPLNVDRYTMETCLGMIAISLSLIMCGSGDLGTFKIFRELRMCLDCEVSYGHHQMYSMCIGFLFLGGGKLTLGHSKLAIAALLISCYPRFPIHSLDNQFHLQILRHLYVLAIEKRHINTIDIDTNLPIKVPIDIEILNIEEEKRENCNAKTITIHKTTPCLLPDYNKICNMKINCDQHQFWNIEFNNLQTNCSGWKSIVDNDGIIYLKKKSGYDTNKGNHDTQYQYNNIVNVINSDSYNKINNNNNNNYCHLLFDNNKKKQSDLVKAFGADPDPNLLEFAKQFCSPFSKMGKFCGYALYDCLTNAKPEMIGTYIKLYHALRISKSSNNYNCVWDIKLLNSYYENYENIDGVKPLIQKEFVAALKNKFETFYRSAIEENLLLVKYIKYGWNLEMYHKHCDIQSLQTLGAFLSYSEIENSFIIKNALKSLQKIKSTNNMDFILDLNNVNNNNNNNKKKCFFILPLLSIAIKSEIKEIKSKFGYNYYGSACQETQETQQQSIHTPSISAIECTETPTSNIMRSTFETPKLFTLNRNRNRKARLYKKNNNNNNTGTGSVLKCLPKSFGLSVLANVLTK